MAERKLAVVITGDAKGAVGAFKATNTAAGGTQSKMQSVAGGVTKAFKTAAVAGGLVGAGLAAGLMKSAGTYKSLVGESAKLQRFLGGSIEEASRFRFVAQQSGIATDTMARGLGLFNKQAVAGKLDGLITNLRDSNGQLRPMSQLLPEVAEKFAKMENGPEKTALAMKLFGKSGADLIPLLNKGADGFGELSKKAEELGLVLTDKDAKAMKEANANSRLWTASLQGVQVQIGRYVLPVLTTFVSFLASKMPGVIKAVAAGAKTMGAAFAPFVAQVGPALQKVADFLRPIVERIREFFANNPDARFAALATVLGGVVLAAVVSLGTAVVGLFSPIYLVVGAVALLVAGVIYAYKHFEGFRNVVDSVASWLTGTALPAIQSFASLVATGFGELVGWVQTHWGQIKGYIEGAINTVATIVGGVIDGLKVAWQTWGTELVSIAQTVWGYIKGTVENGIKLVKGVIDVVMGLIRGDWSTAWDGLKGIVGAVWDQMKLAAETGLKLLASVISAAWDGLKLAVKAAWDGMVSIVSTAIDAEVNFAKNLPGRIVAAVGALGDKLYQAGKDLIAGLVRGIRDAIPDVSSVLGGITNMIPDWKGPADRDKTLLQPAGQLIMNGLVTGINDGIPNLQSRLDFISAMVATQARANVAAFWQAQSAINSQMAGAWQNEDGSWNQSWMGTSQQGAQYAKWLEALRRFFAGGGSPAPSTSRPSDGAKSFPMPRASADGAQPIQIVVQGHVMDGRELGRLAAEGLNEYGASQNTPILATGLVRR